MSKKNLAFAEKKYTIIQIKSSLADKEYMQFIVANKFGKVIGEVQLWIENPMP